ncbi:MAG: ABC transporter [Candidatus Marinimicrobia bacterium]|nr:ABC transporter [Candidatus Neomarinimicrobiota bacterium]|tara:strand:- start:2174 stop:2905 length:732 start_codon:yes stop_codon:yes gene_type:complete
MIEINNLTKRYGDFLAVDDISFNVEKGKILGFLGPNGAGKTTTMRIITGFMPPSEGNVTISGYDVLDEPLLTKNKIGYLPETPPLYLDMTVSEYLNFAGLLKQVPNQKINAAVDNACSKVDINDVKNKVIKALSKGYKQRVGLAQAIIHDPEVLILDEPTIGLDPIQIREVRDLIKSLAGNHTIVLSTHILPEVDMTCDEVVIIKKGKIIAQDTPKNLSKKMNKSSLEEIFIDLISESGLEKK